MHGKAAHGCSIARCGGEDSSGWVFAVPFSPLGEGARRAEGYGEGNLGEQSSAIVSSEVLYPGRMFLNNPAFAEPSPQSGPAKHAGRSVEPRGSASQAVRLHPPPINGRGAQEISPFEDTLPSMGEGIKHNNAAHWAALLCVSPAVQPYLRTNPIFCICAFLAVASTLARIP